MKIVIVGGGSAGWMSATTFIRSLDCDVTLIESNNIPVSGVGESTLASIQDWINFLELGVDELDFIVETDATLKQSIKFTDFLTLERRNSFHYPFGDAQIPPVVWWQNKHKQSKQGHLICGNKYAIGINPLAASAEAGKFDENSIYSYQFDAIKFAHFLKKKYCQNVKHIVSDVIGCKQDSGGIKNLKLRNGEKIEADLFVDCTGFKSLLLGKFLKEPFISYKDLLPNDTALATRVPYRDNDKEKQMVSYTECTAIGNGWVWQIPLWDKIGTGYVYSSKYISDEGAKQEFIDHLSIKRLDTSQCEFKKVPIKAGRYERSFVKNVVAIGLSAGFIEPLEGNGLFSVHHNLLDLTKTLQRGPVSRMIKDSYNKITSINMDQWSQFIAIHYAYTQRQDTPYWKDIFNKEYNFEKGDTYGFVDWGKEIYMFHEYLHLGQGHHYIASGMDICPYTRDSSRSYDADIEKAMYKFAKLEEEIEKLPSLYEFLRDRVYNRAITELEHL